MSCNPCTTFSQFIMTAAKPLTLIKRDANDMKMRGKKNKDASEVFLHVKNVGTHQRSWPFTKEKSPGI